MQTRKTEFFLSFSFFSAIYFHCLFVIVYDCDATTLISCNDLLLLHSAVHRLRACHNHCCWDKRIYDSKDVLLLQCTNGNDKKRHMCCAYGPRDKNVAWNFMWCFDKNKEHFWFISFSRGFLLCRMKLCRFETCKSLKDTSKILKLFSLEPFLCWFFLSAQFLKKKCWNFQQTSATK